MIKSNNTTNKKPEKNSEENLGENQLDEALKTSKRAFIYLIFFGFVASFLTLATSIYSLQVFDRVLSSGSIPTLLWLTVLMVIFSAVLNFIQGIRTSITQGIGKYLNNKLSSLLVNLSFTSLKKSNLNLGISQNIHDLSAIRNFITSPGFITAIDAPWSLIFIIVMFMIHPLPGFIILFGAISLLFLAWVNNFLTKKLSEKNSQLQNQTSRELDIMGKNVEVIEAMRMQNNLITTWQESNKKLSKVAADLHYKINIIANFTKFFRGMIYVAIVASGAILTLKNSMSGGGIIACTILSSRALLPFDQAINLWNSYLNSKKSYLRLKKLIADNFIKESETELPEPVGKVQIEKLSFMLPKVTQPIIKGVNIEVNPGEIVAIIGPTAAGKSTLSKLIAGIYKPTSGAVRLDSADITNWKSEQLSEYIGYLPQDVELFNGNVKTNIARMSSEPDDVKVIEAAKLAHAHDLILRLPKGYESDIGLWGSNISAGQRQRIALARAFYGNPKLVILDEPNSNLDQDGDQALTNCLIGAKQKKITTFIVSHRQHILEAVDKILVMVNGEAKFFGPRDEVLQKLKNPSAGHIQDQKQNSQIDSNKTKGIS